MSSPSIEPFGAWRSKISAADVAQVGMGSALSITELVVSGSGVYWIGRKPEQGGRQVIFQLLPDGSIRERIPKDYNARTSVHEYGGGSYSIHNGVVFFSHYDDQRIYRIEPGSEAVAITPEPSEPRALRYADSIPTPNGRWLIAVREEHLPDGAVINSLVAVPSDGNADPKMIASGHDFYSTPKISPDGRKLAWLSWDHPQMPWYGTELWLANLNAECECSGVTRIAGGVDTSIYQPEWNPGGVLHFISDEKGWWNIYQFRRDQVEPVLLKEADVGYPHWIFGTSRYTFLSNESIALIYTERGMDRLALYDPGEDVLETIDSPLTSFDPPYLQSDDEDALWALAGGAYQVPSLLRIEPGSKQFDIVHSGSPVDHDPDLISPSQAIEFSTNGEKKAYAFFYAPKNPDYRAPKGERPPLIVKSHGGPTSAARSHLQLEIQFWTSRGFAVVDVNYGGSVGFGRSFRERLDGNWGIVDTQDCIAAAQHLVDRGTVDGERLIIRGGSAGGFTTLSALTFHQAFSLGASYYGVPDLYALTTHTHKFEAHYLDRLIGPLPGAEEVYLERSPIHFTDRLSCPMILFQGMEDAVVPPELSESMIDALEEKGLPYAYVVFKEEGHGFRHRENIIRSLEAELSFYVQVLGIETIDPIAALEIHNLG